jgi:hypothetical protein
MTDSVNVAAIGSFAGLPCRECLHLPDRIEVLGASLAEVREGRLSLYAWRFAYNESVVSD